MNLAVTIRATEMLLALAFLQQGFEHLQAAWDERRLFLRRIILSVLLLSGFKTQWVCLALMAHAMFILRRFQGPYNGGSDRMGLLVLAWLVLIHFVPASRWRETVFGYLALQSVLSYSCAGWGKVVNPEWRNGQALQDVFRFSPYPVSESLRAWADRPRLLWYMSWMLMAFRITVSSYLTYACYAHDRAIDCRCFSSRQCMLVRLKSFLLDLACLLPIPPLV
jgi:hypothetical protein